MHLKHHMHLFARFHRCPTATDGGAAAALIRKFRPSSAADPEGEKVGESRQGLTIAFAKGASFERVMKAEIVARDGSW